MPSWLPALTFAVQYNPNCPKPWLVRLVGFYAGGLDNKSNCGSGTKDALGFGLTCKLAALAAQAIVDAQRIDFQRQMHESAARDQSVSEARYAAAQLTKTVTAGEACEQ